MTFVAMGNETTTKFLETELIKGKNGRENAQQGLLIFATMWFEFECRFYA